MGNIEMCNLALKGRNSAEDHGMLVSNINVKKW